MDDGKPISHRTIEMARGGARKLDRNLTRERGRNKPIFEVGDLVSLGASVRKTPSYRGGAVEMRASTTGIVMATSFPFYDPMWQDCRVMTPRGVECWNNEDMKLLSRASPIDGEGEGLVDEPSPEAGVDDPNI